MAPNVGGEKNAKIWYTVHRPNDEAAAYVNWIGCNKTMKQKISTVTVPQSVSVSFRVTAWSMLYSNFVHISQHSVTWNNRAPDWISLDFSLCPPWLVENEQTETDLSIIKMYPVIDYSHHTTFTWLLLSIQSWMRIWILIFWILLSINNKIIVIISLSFPPF